MLNMLDRMDRKAAQAEAALRAGQVTHVEDSPRLPEGRRRLESRSVECHACTGELTDDQVDRLLAAAGNRPAQAHRRHRRPGQRRVVSLLPVRVMEPRFMRPSRTAVVRLPRMTPGVACTGGGVLVIRDGR